MNILLTSAGRRTYLVEYFKAALKNKGKIFAANSEYTYALSQADEHVITPLIYDDNYIPFLLGFCKKNEITVVISLFDIDLPALSKNKSLFEKSGVQVIISDESVIDICNDKWLSFEFLKSNGINTPLTFIEKDKAKVAIENGELNFPVILKPRWGMGSIGIYKADDVNELDVFYHKVSNEIKNSYLKHESGSDINSAILIQQYITGDEFGIEVINDLKNNYVNTFCKKKIAMRSGETDLALTIESASLADMGKVLSDKLKHTLILDVDCFELDGLYYVLEMNARFGGQYPFSHLAGANLPKQVIEWCNNGETINDLVSINFNVLSGKNIEPVRIDNATS